MKETNQSIHAIIVFFSPNMSHTVQSHVQKKMQTASSFYSKVFSNKQKLFTTRYRNITVLLKLKYLKKSHEATTKKYNVKKVEHESLEWGTFFREREND
jgi:hypothetical protein